MNRKQRRKAAQKKTNKKSSATPAPNALSEDEARALFDLAGEKMLAGDLDGAKADLGKVLEIYPHHLRSLYLRGRIAFLQEDMDTALIFLKKAATDKFAEPHCDIGVIHRATGRLDDAAESYHKALKINPDIPEANANLANSLRELGQLEHALQYYEKAIKLKPDFAEAYYNLGMTLNLLDRQKEADTYLQKAISLNPESPSAHTELGSVYWKGGYTDKAAACFMLALEIDSTFSPAHTNMAAVHFKKHQFEDAIACARKAIDLNPNDVSSFNILGGSLHQLGQIEEGYTKMLRGISIDPTNAETRFNMGISLLLRGKFEEGWPAFEYRLKNNLLKLDRGFDRPYWQGEELGDKTLLIYTEQGLGDTIQFGRYIPHVRAHVKNIILEIEEKLVETMRPLIGDIPVIIKGKVRLPSFDVHSPLTSLPGICKTNLETIPATTPYLKADPIRVRWWRDRLAGEDLKIGLVWSGNPEHSNDKSRSMPLEEIKPLLALKGIRLYGLQVGEAARQLQEPWAAPIEDLSELLTSFSETSAAMMNLDLTISVDTAPAHLAGALGRPVWAMLAHVSDWRWMRDRDDTPWYPTMRLFRQQTRGDWTKPVLEIKKALQEKIAS
jgi:tetratricopeptide (TPR) repeat protein